MTSGTEETHTLSSYGISSNQAMSSIFQLFPATSLTKSIVEIFSDDDISMLSSKEGPIISKRIYKSEPAFSNCKVEWIMSLLGIMILIGYQSEMGLGKYAWKKEGSLYYPAFIYPSGHCIPESANDIYSITTRYFLSATVINYDDVQYSDANMYWKPKAATGVRQKVAS